MGVSVIGTGAMGSALARTLSAGGVPVTAWNRTPDRARPLAAEGIVVADSLRSAISANTKIIVCVKDYAASRAMLEECGADASLSARSILQVSTGTPAEAVEAAAWAQSVGADYLEGAIMVYPGDIGTETAQILISGPESQFDDWAPHLRLLSADLRYVGENIQAAATLDLALLSRLLCLKFGAIFGAHLCEAERVDIQHFADLMQDGDPAKVSARTIASGDFTLGGGSASAAVALGVVSGIQGAARDAGIATALPDLLVAFYEQTVAAGFGDEDSSAVIKAFRAARPVE